jgi:hypothetical protein
MPVLQTQHKQARTCHSGEPCPAHLLDRHSGTKRPAIPLSGRHGGFAKACQQGCHQSVVSSDLKRRRQSVTMDLIRCVYLKQTVAKFLFFTKYFSHYLQRLNACTNPLECTTSASCKMLGSCSEKLAGMEPLKKPPKYGQHLKKPPETDKY